MHNDLDRIILTRDQIAQRIEELGAVISRDMNSASDDGELVILAVLAGSVVFVADLIRQLPQKLRVELVAVNSYPGKATQSYGPLLADSLPDDLSGKHVLIVDDILDSGQTIAMLRSKVRACNPLSVRACVLLRKTIDSALGTPCEYIGFDIPDCFVIGYGLDYDNYYRNLPDVAVLKSDRM